jgi:tetratricopeptide (TPR) repeat protein
VRERRPGRGRIASAGAALGALLAALGAGCAGLDRSSVHLERGEDALARREFQDAHDHFRYALDARRNHPRALLGLARACTALGQSERALDLFFALEQVDPASLRAGARADYAQALLQAAEVRLRRGDPVEALRYLRHAEALDPDHPGLAEALPRARIAASGRLRVAGRAQEARALFGGAAGAEPAPAEAAALAQALLAQRELDRAISVLSDALSQSPAEPRLQTLLEQALERRYPDPPCHLAYATCAPAP